MQDRTNAPTASGKSVPWGGPEEGWRHAVYRIAFESETPAGRLFDKVLVFAILTSVAVVIADSVPALNRRWWVAFDIAEWAFTALFTVEYLLRLSCQKRPSRYALSFFGIVDLLAVLPTYLAMLFPAIHVLIDVRILRLLRIFRIFKLTAYISEYQTLAIALAASWRKIMVFLSAVALIVIVMGSLMYVVEGPAHGFTSIPTSIYWAITTMTTVGYGDITPQSPLGRFVTALMMLVGWGTLAVPTGIVTSEIALRHRVGGLFGGQEPAAAETRPCPECGEPRHIASAAYCHRCGARLAGSAVQAGSSE
ncbi:MAG: ion transporter [Novosphingobium sp.]|nr:ion transporter [Novosphingobium sp.]